MKKNSTMITIFFLLGMSTIIYFLQLMHFHDPRDTFFYFMQDLAFLPIQVALVTIAIGKIIGAREKRERLNKTNILVSAFFSEIGTELIHQLLSFVCNTEEIAPYFDVKNEWTSKDFSEASSSLKEHDIIIDCPKNNLQDLKELLKEDRMSIMMFLSNPVLLEHESFTDMILAISHLTDELLARNSVFELPDSDINHLSNDINRAVGSILVHWLGYMHHIKNDYPYLFSIELRRNPIFRDNEITIK